MANKSKGTRHTTVIRIPVPLYEAIADKAAEIDVGLNDFMVCLLHQALEQGSGHACAPAPQQTSSVHTCIQR